MNIAQKLKQLREQNGLTQEYLANYLGITYQAVSKWERGEGYPDITLLPVIANFFEVTTDELLCVDTSKKQTEVNKIIKNFKDYYSKGDLKNAKNVLEKGLAKYPNEHGLTLELIHLKSQMQYDSRQTEKKVLTESVKTLKRILSQSTDPHVRNYANILLIRHLTELDRNSEALELAKYQADMNSSSTVLMCDLTEGEERLKNIRDAIRLTVEELNGLISRLGDYDYDNGYTLKEKIELRELGIKCNELILADEAYVGFGWNYWRRCEKIAKGYCRIGDSENALYWLEKAADIAARADALHGEYTYKTLKNDDYRTLANEPRFNELLQV